MDDGRRLMVNGQLQIADGRQAMANDKLLAALLRLGAWCFSGCWSLVLGAFICRFKKLAASTAHTPHRRDEVRLSDVMALFFLPDHGLQESGDGFVRIVAAQARAQVVLGDAEVAGADFSIGRQTQPVAMPAEWFAHW